MTNEQCLINAQKMIIRRAESEIRHLQADLQAAQAQPRIKRAKAVAKRVAKPVIVGNTDCTKSPFAGAYGFSAADAIWLV